VDKFLIRGGARLEGELPVSGAKNSALPALAACLLTEEPVRLRGIPQVRDIRTMVRLLEHIGAQVQADGEDLCVQAAHLSAPEAPYELVKTMRASSLVQSMRSSGVSMGPGQMALARMPCFAYCTASDLVSAIIPPLLAV